jgi:phosphohistidine phosphatase
MKKLILLRHAKSSWKDVSINDFDRPLNKRGNRDVSTMADTFLNRNIKLDLIISSSAKRTVDTAKVFAETLGFGSNILIKDELYEASSYEILKCINQIDNIYNNVLIVCHNPGITNLSNYLSDFMIDNIPTTGIVGLSFENNWKEIKGKSGSFLFFDYPKKYFKRN